MTAKIGVAEFTWNGESALFEANTPAARSIHRSHRMALNQFIGLSHSEGPFAVASMMSYLIKPDANGYRLTEDEIMDKFWPDQTSFDTQECQEALNRFYCELLGSEYDEVMAKLEKLAGEDPKKEQAED